MAAIEEFLTENTIAFEPFEHAAVFTCEESEKLPPMPGYPTKNLLLRDRKGVRHILVTLGHEKATDLKALKEILAADKLSFASPEDLQQYLGVTPGSVTILGLICDKDRHLEVIVDEAVWKADAVQCHPLRNNATFVLSHEGLEKFLNITGHVAKVLDIPARK